MQHIRNSKIGKLTIEFSNNGVIDSLCGAPAPKVFFENLNREIARSQRRYDAISILTIKVLGTACKLKKDNANDPELRLLSANRVIKSKMRSGDFYSRLVDSGFWICLQ